MLFLNLTENIKKDTIAKKTCQNYIYLWKYRYDKKKKSIYYDRYKRLDVIEYKKRWLKRMFIYKKFMKKFDDDILNIVLEFEFKSEKKKFV